MKLLRLKVITVFATFSFFACAHADISQKRTDDYDHRVIDGNTGVVISLESLAKIISKSDIIILGEKHNTPAVQKAQAEIIQLTLRKIQKQFTVGWEFLNFSDQSVISKSWTQYQQNQISGLEFLKQTQGNLVNDSYLPVLDVTRTFGGRIIGTNLSRAEKAPVVERGIDGLNPGLLPPQFDEGSDFYRERFYKVMGDHAPEYKLKNYFTAQSLVDDVMALQLTQDKQPLKFLITGSFHMDYNDAVIARIKIRAPTAKVTSIRVIDASDYTESELSKLRSDDRYGVIADYLFMVNEPTR